MFHFVAFAWNSQCDEECEQAKELDEKLRGAGPELNCVLDQVGIRVYCAGLGSGSTTLYRLPENGGVLLGVLFERHAPDANTSKKAQFSVRETEELLQSQGSILTERYWGRYVGFLTEPHSGTTRVIRSPTGEITCLHTRQGAVHIFFSSIPDITALRQHFSIDWEYVAAYLSTTLLEGSRTGLKEVSRLLHGECFSLCGGKVRRRYYWHPARFAVDRLEDPTEAAEALRETAKRCVHAWASCYSGILHLLSGGLDSSIVLGCLTDAPTRPRITCLNYRNSRDPGTDERSYARLAAARAGCTMVEHEWQTHYSLDDITRLPRRASPYNSVFEVGLSDVQSEIARQNGATASFAGTGGDQIFYQNGARFSCAEYMQLHGLNLAAFKIALDAARMEGVAVWPLFWRAMKEAGSRNRENLLSSETSLGGLVRADLKRTMQERYMFVHPWLSDTSQLPLGKYWQIVGMCASLEDELHSPSARPGDPENLSPLMSQPLIELCLRIPTYLLTQRGIDRALARRAFQNDVPPEILRRCSKAVVFDYAKGLVAANRDFARELLCGGLLIKERVLDERRTAEAISASGPSASIHAIEILSCLTAEAWASQWA